MVHLHLILSHFMSLRLGQPVLKIFTKSKAEELGVLLVSMYRQMSHKMVKIKSKPKYFLLILIPGAFMGLLPLEYLAVNVILLCTYCDRQYIARVLVLKMTLLPELKLLFLKSIDFKETSFRKYLHASTRLLH
jgi:hypothetical protein